MTEKQQEDIHIRYVQAVERLAIAEGRTDIKDADLDRLYYEIYTKPPADMENQVVRMNYRAQLIDETVERTKENHANGTIPIGLFSDFGKGRPSTAEDFIEGRTRRGCAKMSNALLKRYKNEEVGSISGADVMADKPDPTEIRSSDIITPSHHIFHSTSKWRGFAEALEAKNKGAPWERGR